MGRWMAFTFALGVVAAMPSGPAAAASGEVIVLRLAGTIQPGSARYLDRGLAEAARRQAALVIFELDTPGGLLDSSRHITTALATSAVPVAVYVAPAGARAASAGFFVLLAADIAAMAPGTNTGAAHPLALGRRDGKESDTRREKAVSDAAAAARSLATRRGRPPDLAEQAVRSSRAFSEHEALAAKLIDVVAPSRASLIQQLDGRPLRRLDGRTERLRLAAASVAVLEPTLGDRFLMVVADPTVAYLLLIFGVIGLSIELLHPGFILPGVVGALSLLLALYALSVLPVSLAGLALMVLGLGFLIAEAFVTSYGLLALGGLASFVVGSLILFGGSGAGPRLSLAVVLPVAAVLGATTLLLLTKALRAQKAPGRSGVEALVGAEGEVVAPLEPTGFVAIRGEYWQAVSNVALPRGTRVRVVGAEGRRLTVEATQPKENEEEVKP